MKGKTNEKGDSTSTGTFVEPVSYIFGRTQHFIEVYATGNGLSARELAAGLAALLHATSRREVLGLENRMPTLPGPSAKRGQGSRKMAMARNSHRKPAQVRRAHTGAENGATKATALEILKQEDHPMFIPDIAARMIIKNPTIKSKEAAAQCLYHMKKRKELKVNSKGEVSLPTAA